jgi:hypothetical protein
MLPKYRGRPVCRCGECRKCKNREAVYRYRESRDPITPEENERIEQALRRCALSGVRGASESVSGEVATGSL